MSCESAKSKIEAIYLHSEIDECISKLVRKDLQQDFKQELFLILLQIPCEKIVSLNGGLKYYIVKIILNLIRQERNIFHKKYLDRNICYDNDKLKYESISPAETDTMTERVKKEAEEDETIARLETIDNELGNLGYPFYKKIITMIAETGSLRGVSRKTGIPFSTIQRTVNKVRGKLV